MRRIAGARSWTAGLHGSSIEDIGDGLPPRNRATVEMIVVVEAVKPIRMSEDARAHVLAGEHAWHLRPEFAVAPGHLLPGNIDQDSVMIVPSFTDRTVPAS